MKWLFFIGYCFPLYCFSQVGGTFGYPSLLIPSNPRTAALAGTSYSLADGDISQFFNNPSCLDSVVSQTLFFHVNPHFADAIFYSINYSFDISHLKQFGLGVNFLNFGTFQLLDETGNELGHFQASDYSIYLGKAFRFGPFSFGTSLKFLNTSIDSYSSSALVMDFGGIFRLNPKWNFAMVIKNVGTRLSNNSSFSSPTIPIEIAIGTTFQPSQMPVRFTLSSNGLTNKNQITSTSSEGRSYPLADRIFRKINLGSEIIINRHFNVLLGYNHKRKQELQLNDVRSGAGLSFGFMFKLKQIELRFSNALYHVAGNSSFFSIQTNLKEFNKIL